MRSISQPLVLIDVETTGLSPVHSRIIDIACIRIENGTETKRFVSLVDPDQPLPRSIEALTGIMDAHLKSAPSFHQIAPEIAEICKGALFVAHNARFDYSFIKAEMERAGIPFRKKTLCTVKLSRKFYDTEARHDLSSLIRRHGFTCTERHRALGDAEVLVQFLAHLEKIFPSDIIRSFVEEVLKKTTLPPGIDASLIASLPEAPGVYTFYDKDGATLYIGKSKGIRSRVQSHFSNTHREGKEMRLWQETAHIDYIETVSELGASLLELYKIKHESPALNRLSRRTRALWLLKKKASPLGLEYLSFTLEKSPSISPKDFKNIYAIFRNKNQAVECLDALCREESLCPKLMGIETGEGPCFSSQLEKCSGACGGKPSVKTYNTLVEKIFAAKKITEWPNKKPAVLRFYNEEQERAEVFTIDQWILKKALVFENDEPRNFLPVGDEEIFFDYDVYKVLVRHLLSR